MRKAVLFMSGVALAAALPGRVTAQEDTVVVVERPLRTTFGIKGGLSFATLSESNLSPNFGNQTGFAAGIHVALPLGNSILMFQPEALLSQQGATSPTPTGTLTDEGQFELTYISIPANLRVNLSVGGAQPYLQDVDFDCDNFKDTDWGLGFGAGVKFGRQGGFFIEGRYALGLTDINNLSEGFNAKNRVFLALAGISF
jgi:hypothetical protein